MILTKLPNLLEAAPSSQHPSLLRRGVRRTGGFNNKSRGRGGFNTLSAGRGDFNTKYAGRGGSNTHSAAGLITFKYLAS